jgi:hypothetical protein
MPNPNPKKVPKDKITGRPSKWEGLATKMVRIPEVLSDALQKDKKFRKKVIKQAQKIVDKEPNNESR